MPEGPARHATRAALLCLLLSAAAGAIEAAGRIAIRRDLWDSRIDALLIALWGIGFYAVAGLILGTAVGLLSLLAPRLRVRLPARLIILLFLAPVLVGAGLLARQFVGRTELPTGTPSLVLITVDTLRADALGAFHDGRPMPPGLERASTPNLDALASRGCVFLEAATPIPKTPQAFASIMTGTYPSKHGLRNLFGTLHAGNLTLAEILRDKGWDTRAVITNDLIARLSGLSQGFDSYLPRDGLRSEVKSFFMLQVAARVAPRLLGSVLDRLPMLSITREDAREVTDRGLDALRAVSGHPYFLWIHYLDPHWPYTPPEPWLSRADTEPGQPMTIYSDVRSQKVLIGDIIHRNNMSSEMVRRLSSLYSGEVSYLDNEVGRLLEAIRASPDAANTIIIFTSDHGESLGEHRYFFSHGDQVYEPSMRVPLIVESPDCRGGRRVSEPVSLVDIASTALDLMSQPVPEVMQGISLAPLVRAAPGGSPDTEESRRVIFGQSDLSYLAGSPWLTIPGEAGKMRSVRMGSWKFIRIPRNVEVARRLDPSLGAKNAKSRNPLQIEEATKLGPSAADIEELYDLSTDPTETIDLSRRESGRRYEMSRILDERLEAILAPAGPWRQRDQELMEVLRSFGYTQMGESR